MPTKPNTGRPLIPDVYGLPGDSEFLSWSQVDKRIEQAIHYWISTVDPNARPNPRPIDGMWLDNTLYFGGDPQSRWQRNLRANPKSSINLEDAEHAVILQGETTILVPDSQLVSRLVDASNAKYKMGQKAADYEGEPVCAFSPDIILAWDTLYQDATRFDFRN